MRGWGGGVGGGTTVSTNGEGATKSHAEGSTHPMEWGVEYQTIRWQDQQVRYLSVL